jgi:two-component system chemotaxis response regulator CheY
MKYQYVLVVDDSSTMRRIIKGNLIRLNFLEKNIKEAGDGIEAISILANNPIDLIITDWNMPNMNGLELVKKIRSNLIYNNTPIIMVTTEGNKSAVITALKAGVNNYIVKPFTPATLHEKIKEYI